VQPVRLDVSSALAANFNPIYAHAASRTFNPASLGAVTGWLRNSTVGALASVPDVINVGNPATQGVAGRQPAGNAAGDIVFDGGDALVYPLVANQNKNVTTMGFAFWCEVAQVATNQLFIAIDSGAGGASVRTMSIYAAGTALRSDLGNNGLVGRRATASSIFAAATKVFVTVEFNGNMPAEATRHVMTANAVVLGPSFTALSGGLSDVVLNNPTGNIIIGGNANADVGVNPITVGGRMRHVWPLTAAMPGATEGLLTQAGRLALMGLDPMV
jgi:hypothetical protein